LILSSLAPLAEVTLNRHQTQYNIRKLVMPLEEKDMDKLFKNQTIDRKYTDFLSTMEKGKYYSQSEMASLILGRPLAITESLIDLEKTDLKEKLERLNEVMGDISFVNCALEINRAIGKLKVAEKNNDLYYTLI